MLFLVYYSSKPMFLTIYATSGKKVLDPNGPYISTSPRKIRNVCLSVILELCLPSVCSASTAYTNLFSGLKYLPKNLYFIPVYFNLVGFLIFETLCFWAGRKHCPVRKNHKNERHLCLAINIFPKLS